MTIIGDAIEPPAIIRAILVTPTRDKLIIKNVFLYTLMLPGNGLHLDPGSVAHQIGSRRLRFHRLHDGEGLLTVSDSSGPSWHCCCTGPHRGPGLVLQLFGNGNVIGDTRLDLEQAAGMLALDEVEDEEAHHGCQAA